MYSTKVAFVFVVNNSNSKIVVHAHDEETAFELAQEQVGADGGFRYSHCVSGPGNDEKFAAQTAQLENSNETR